MNCPPITTPTEPGAQSDARPRLLLSGLDSLYVSYFLEMSTGRLDWDELACQKERLRHSRTDHHAEAALGSQRFALMPYGRKPYTYVLSNPSFEVRLSEHTRPSCHVQVYSEALWRHGVGAVLGQLEEWFRSMRFHHTRPNVVSRADWAFDYHIPCRDFAWDDFVSVAEIDNSWRKHRKTQTFHFGIGASVVRVYDKAAEIREQSGKSWFHDLWGRKDQVWRAEFQVRNERLSQAGIESTTDISAYQGDLLRQLAQRHTTLRVPNGDSNRSRWSLHPLWRALLDDIDQLPATGLIRNIDPRGPLNWRLHQQTKSLYGTLKGIAALRRIITRSDDPIALNDLIAQLPGILFPHHDAMRWAEDVARRVSDHELGRW
jgi:hypothetical protein